MKTLIKNAVFTLQHKESFIQQAALVIGWTSLSQLIIFLGIPFVTRIYTPQMFGIYAVYSAMIYILNGVVALGSELLIPNPKQDEQGASLLITAMINVLLVNAIISLIFFLDTNNSLFTSLNLSQLQAYKWLIPLGGIFIGLRNCLLYWLIRMKEFNQVGIARFTQAPMLVGVQVIVGFFYPHPSTLIIGGALSWLSADIYLLIKILNSRYACFKWETIKAYMSNMKQHKYFIGHSFSSLLLLGLSNYMPTILFAINFNPIIAAWYAMAYQAFSPLDLLSNAIIQLYIGEGNRIMHQQPEELRKFYVKMLKGLSLFILIPILIVTLFGAPLFALVFGSKWQQAGVYAQIMAFAMMMRFVVLASSQNLAVLKKQGITLLWSMLYIVLIFSAFLPVQLIPSFSEANYTISLLAIAMLISYTSLIIINLHVIRQHTNTQPDYSPGFNKASTSRAGDV